MMANSDDCHVVGQCFKSVMQFDFPSDDGLASGSRSDRDSISTTSTDNTNTAS
jgi:hypothetical protein